jgi:hypothetical protein
VGEAVTSWMFSSSGCVYTPTNREDLVSKENIQIDFVCNCIAGLLVGRVAVLVALSDVDLKSVLLGRTLTWNCIDGMITSRRNRFGSNAAAEFEVRVNGCVYN